MTNAKRLVLILFEDDDASYICGVLLRRYNLFNLFQLFWCPFLWWNICRTSIWEDMYIEVYISLNNDFGKIIRSDFYKFFYCRNKPNMMYLYNRVVSSD